MKLSENELENLLNSMELEEPSMPFTRNVMEQLKHERIPVSLKTRVDKRIIHSLAIIFILAILAILFYTGLNTNFSSKLSGLNMDIKFSAEDVNTQMLMRAFLLLDLIILLLYFDRLLRRKLRGG